MAAKRLKKKKSKVEFSKVFCSVVCALFFLLGVWMISRYYTLTKLAIEMNSVSTPDASLPIAGITFIFAPVLSYLMYQGGLKNSRNKYGIDSEGQPYMINGEGNE